MIPRELTPRLTEAARQLPVVTLTGPRQSGKTTLCRAAFPDKPWINLEPLDTRGYATEDPRGFLADLPHGAILDEIQNTPDLLSYIQADVDTHDEPGRFILTGSQQLGLSAAVSQTLAGRTAVLNLLPFSLGERRQSETWSDDLWTDVFRGGYPRIYDRALDAAFWYRDYLTTYVDRDVRQLKGITDLNAFQTFLSLAAGRTAQELNFSSLGSDAGISYNTARAWIGILEATFLARTAPAWHRNLRKQIVRTSKLHFLDSGLLCALLGIRDPLQLKTHPLRGAIFETWVAGELIKHRVNRRLPAGVKHYRESRGPEINLIVEDGLHLDAIECKSGATVHPSAGKALEQFAGRLREAFPRMSVRSAVVYGGETTWPGRKLPLYAWRDVVRLAERTTETD